MKNSVKKEIKDWARNIISRGFLAIEDTLKTMSTRDFSEEQQYRIKLLWKEYESQKKKLEKEQKQAEKIREKKRKEIQKEVERLDKLQEKNPYFVVVEGGVRKERWVDLILVTAPMGQRVGRFQGYAGTQFDTAIKFAQQYAKKNNISVFVRDTFNDSENGFQQYF